MFFLKVQQITRRKNENLADLKKSNAVDCGITTTLAYLLNSFSDSQFSLGHLSGSEFEKKTPNPLKVIIKRNHLTIFYKYGFEGNSYNPDYPDLRYFLSNTIIGNQQFKINYVNLNFLEDLGY